MFIEKCIIIIQYDPSGGRMIVLPNDYFYKHLIPLE
jgi:hypothetical protein